MSQYAYGRVSREHGSVSPLPRAEGARAGAELRVTCRLLIAILVASTACGPATPCPLHSSTRPRARCSTPTRRPQSRLRPPSTPRPPCSAGRGTAAPTTPPSRGTATARTSGAPTAATRTTRGSAADRDHRRAQSPDPVEPHAAHVRGVRAVEREETAEVILTACADFSSIAVFLACVLCTAIGFGCGGCGGARRRSPPLRPLTRARRQRGGGTATRSGRAPARPIAAQALRSPVDAVVGARLRPRRSSWWTCRRRSTSCRCASGARACRPPTSPSRSSSSGTSGHDAGREAQAHRAQLAHAPRGRHRALHDVLHVRGVPLRVPSVRTLALLRDLHTLHLRQARDALRVGDGSQARHLRSIAESVAATATALYRKRVALLARR